MKNGVVKFAIVMTVLSAIYAIANNHNNPVELVGSLIFDFVIWLLIGAIGAWLDEKLLHRKKDAVSRKDYDLDKVRETKTTGGKEPSPAGQDAKTKKCPECSRDNLADVAFCSYCGHKFGLICPNCGRENLPDANIC